MASLQELLSEDGFDEHRKLIRSQKKVKFRDKTAQNDSIVLPIYICHDRRSFDGQKHKSDKASSRNGSSVSSTRRGGLDSGKSISRATEDGLLRRSEPAIDEVAIRAVVSILSGYVGQYLSDKKFRKSTRAKCYSRFVKDNQDLDNGIFANLQMGIENIERLVENQETKKELKMKAVQYSIRLLSIVASLNSKSSKNGSTCGIPNSHLSACAQLYLSVVYKIEKNDRMSARHLLQVFCDAPFLARTHLLPEVWEHLFLPHLLHLKIWYTEELQFLSDPNYFDGEIKMKALNEAYNDQLDIGTHKFALYYKKWLKVGAEDPAVPSVPLPARLNHTLSRRNSDSFTTRSSTNELLYRAVFGPILERCSMDLNDRDGDFSYDWCLEEQEQFSTNKDVAKHCSYVEKRPTRRQRSSGLSHRKMEADLWEDEQKSDRFHLINCRSDSTDNSVHVVPSSSTKKDRYSWKNDLDRAISTVCTSDSVNEREMAIRMMTMTWLDSHGDPLVEAELSNIEVIEGILEIISLCNDDEILEQAISILAQIALKKEFIGNIILNFDPQLDIFVRLLRNNSLFLKAASLLYLVKPKAEQMTAMEWIPLVLRVLEFGDQLQTLFTIQCSPQVAAYYFLDQLLLCFDEDRNMENARYVISLGGLNLLARGMEMEDISEKNKAASIIYCCIQADGRCRHYLAKNLKKDSLIQLLVHKNQIIPRGQGFALLTELFCLNRHHQRTEFLNELKNGWGSLNTLHIMLVYLQRAPPEERPIVAAVLLQLDLLEDPSECSVYREEVIEEIVKALDCEVLNEKVQEQTARALMILGGHFSYTGEPVAEKWILKQAGLDENSCNSFTRNKTAISNYTRLIREDDETEWSWQRKTATVLLKSGNKRLLVALSDSIANGIPCLARASLVTVAWICSFLQSIGEGHFQSLACSTLVPQLLEALDYDKTLEERTLASFSLVNLLKDSDYLFRLSTMNKELINHLHKLSQVTWTAKELISIIQAVRESDALM